MIKNITTTILAAIAPVIMAAAQGKFVFTKEVTPIISIQQDVSDGNHRLYRKTSLRRMRTARDVAGNMSRPQTTATRQKRQAIPVGTDGYTTERHIGNGAYKRCGKTDTRLWHGCRDQLRTDGKFDQTEQRGPRAEKTLRIQSLHAHSRQGILSRQRRRQGMERTYIRRTESRPAHNNTRREKQMERTCIHYRRMP